MLNTMVRDEQAFKAWRRALNASRKEVVKLMEKAGYRISVWTKRDKGRTIMQVYIPDAEALQLLQRTVRRINLKWAARMVCPVSGTQDGTCYDDGFKAAEGTCYTIMHSSLDRIEDNGQFAQYGRKG